jgi:hypothetical protein
LKIDPGRNREDVKTYSRHSELAMVEMSDMGAARLQPLKRSGTSIDQLTESNCSNYNKSMRVVLLTLVIGGPRSVVWVKFRVAEAT